MNRIGARTTVNIGYNAIVSGVFGSAVLSNIILARHLSSVDYGIVNFAKIFIGFIAMFSDFGINTALIQRKDSKTEPSIRGLC